MVNSARLSPVTPDFLSSEKLVGKITIAVPTFNRYKKLAVLLSFLNSNFPKISILVLDSSTQKQQLNDLYKDNVNVIEFEPHISLCEKLLEGVRTVDTPFVSICADDDFIFPGGTIEAIDFLEKEPTYSFAHGAYLNYQHYPDFQKTVFSHRYLRESMNSASTNRRLIKHAENYIPVVYVVHRAEKLTRALENAFNFTPDNFSFELAVSFSIIAAGKEKRTPSLYYLRDQEVVEIFKIKDLRKTKIRHLDEINTKKQLIQALEAFIRSSKKNREHEIRAETVIASYFQQNQSTYKHSKLSAFKARLIKNIRLFSIQHQRQQMEYVSITNDLTNLEKLLNSKIGATANKDLRKTKVVVYFFSFCYCLITWLKKLR